MKLQSMASVKNAIVAPFAKVRGFKFVIQKDAYMR